MSGYRRRTDLIRLRAEINDCEQMLTGGAERLAAALRAAIDVIDVADRRSEWAIHRSDLVSRIGGALG